MNHIHADDGRILTPPTELEPMLNGAFPAFSDLLGHIRFFYMVDEIWDGESSLAFISQGERLAAFTLDDGVFHVHIADETFSIADETPLSAVYEALKKYSVPGQCRPAEQLTLYPNDVPCGYRCDLCLGSKNSDANNFTVSENFGYMNWLCYHNCVPGTNIERFDGIWNCPGCAETRKSGVCRLSPCHKAMGDTNCAECGKYHSCDTLRVSHYPGQSNLGLTADEVTSLVIPYAVKERLEYAKEALI